MILVDRSASPIRPSARAGTPRLYDRRAVREASRSVEVRCRLGRVRDVTGVANYVFERTNSPGMKAELTPGSFRGKMFVASNGFLVKPIEELWSDVRRDGDAIRQAAASIAAPQMRRVDMTDAGSR